MIENVIQIKSGITVSIGVSIKIKKQYVQKTITCTCEILKYLESIITTTI